jgi:N-acetylmuramoyl-L-alanine amidase
MRIAAVSAFHVAWRQALEYRPAMNSRSLWLSFSLAVLSIEAAMAQTPTPPTAPDADKAAPAASLSAPTNAPAAVESAATYTVTKGDNLSTIAKQHKVSLKELIAANPGIDIQRIMVGQKLNLPTAKAAVATAPATPASAGAPNEAKSYRVKAGDNLSKIAKAHGVSVPALREANQLPTDTLMVGQQLTIPAPAAAQAATRPAPPR